MEQLKRLHKWLGANSMAKGSIPEAPFIKGDLIGQLRAIWKVTGMRRVNGRGQVGYQTSYLHLSTNELIIRQLQEAGWRGTLIFNIRQEDLKVLLTKWAESDLKAATLVARVTALRKLMTILGRPELIPADTANLGLSRERLRRTQVAARDKSNGMTDWQLEQIAAKIEMDEPIVAHLVRLCWYFGLRRKEAAMCRLETMRQQDGHVLLIDHGTKGGRERKVPITTDAQARVVRDALRVCNVGESLTGSLGGLRAALNRCTYICRKHGLTAKALGITPHGLRHGFAQQQLKARGLEAGLTAEAGQEKPPVEQRNEALLEIAHMLGHGRIRVGANYYGSTRDIRVAPVTTETITTKWSSSRADVTYRAGRPHSDAGEVL
jgi:integrase